MIPLAFFVSLLFLYSLLSRRMERTIVTAPIVFTVAGMLDVSRLARNFEGRFTANAALHIAEVGLVMLLFTDASRTDLNILRSIRKPSSAVAERGMLLTIAFGQSSRGWFFRNSPIWEAGILSRHPCAHRRRPGTDDCEQPACAAAHPSRRSMWKPVSTTDFPSRSSCSSSP